MDLPDFSNTNNTQPFRSLIIKSVPTYDEASTSDLYCGTVNKRRRTATSESDERDQSNFLNEYFWDLIVGKSPSFVAIGANGGTSYLSTPSTSKDNTGHALNGNTKGDQATDTDDIISPESIKKKPLESQSIMPFLEEQHPMTSSGARSPGNLTQLALRNVNSFAQAASIWTTDGSIEWSMDDNKRMNELCRHAAHILGNCDPQHRVNEQNFTEIDMTIVLDVTSRQMIEMCKNIGEFRLLNDDTQMKLIKDNITTMCALRGNLNYDPIMQAFRPTHLADGWLVKFDQVKHFDFYKIWKWFYPSFESTLVQDRPLILLLMAISLFHQNSVDQTNEQSLAVYQNRAHYNRMLQAYLIARIGSKARAMAIYQTLMQNKNKLRQLHQDAAKFLGEQPSSEHVNHPLLMELYEIPSSQSPSSDTYNSNHTA